MCSGFYSPRGQGAEHALRGVSSGGGWRSVVRNQTSERANQGISNQENFSLMSFLRSAMKSS